MRCAPLASRPAPVRPRNSRSVAGAAHGNPTWSRLATSAGLQREEVGEPEKDLLDRIRITGPDSGPHCSVAAGTVTHQDPYRAYWYAHLAQRQATGGAASGSGALPAQRLQVQRKELGSPPGPETPPFAESKELADCVRIMGPDSVPYCRQAVLGEPIPVPEDWNFTPAEYVTAKRFGGLKFAAGSEWFPDPLKKNLLATFDKVLDPKLRDVTEGVNIKDFYHGHVVIPHGKARLKVRDAVAAFGAEFQKAYAQALGGQWTEKVTKENLPAFAKALREIQPSAQKLLELALQVPETAVLYHTLESNKPRWMDPGDPKRNWLTPLATNIPAGFTPPNIKKAGSFDEVFFVVLHFAFLIDSDGVIYLRHGSERELSTITGKPQP